MSSSAPPSGATYETINPATEEVLGVAADATVADAERSIAAARRAFDTTEWSRDQRLPGAVPPPAPRRARRATPTTCARSSCTRSARRCRARPARSSTARPRSCGGTPICSRATTSSEDLGDREAFGLQNHRWIEKEAAGVVGAIAAYNYPVQLALAKLAPALAAGCTVVLKGAPDTPWSTLALGRLIAEATDIPPGVVNVADVVRQTRSARC